MTGRWYPPVTLLSSINKTNRHDISEILLKVALNTIKQMFGRGGRERMVCLSPPTVVSLNPVLGEVYSIQHHDYVVKFVCDLRQIGDFLPVPCTNKTDHHDITELLLKVFLHSSHVFFVPIRYSKRGRILQQWL